MRAATLSATRPTHPARAAPLCGPRSGGVVDLGTLPGGDFSQAFGSNGAGDIVGASTSTVGSRAVLWTRGGVQDLNSLIAPSTFVLTKAVGITAGGMIIAIGHVPAAGHQHRPAGERSAPA